jgi:hypothetical protein
MVTLVEESVIARNPSYLVCLGKHFWGSLVKVIVHVRKSNGHGSISIIHKSTYDKELEENIGRVGERNISSMHRIDQRRRGI